MNASSVLYTHENVRGFICTSKTLWVIFQASDRVVFSEENTKVTLIEVKEEDSGVYQCVAVNRGGSIVTNTSLRVGGKTSYIPHICFSLNCLNLKQR